MLAGGNQLDEKDERSAGLLHLIDILTHIQPLPEFFFLENVPLFESSHVRNVLIETLFQKKYFIKEFLVSPVSLGIPNNRKRYYLLARLSSQPMPTPPNIQDIYYDFQIMGIQNCELKPLNTFLETNIKLQEYKVVPNDIRKRTNFQFDVVVPQSLYCSTFTKAYGSHHFFGSGSFLQTKHVEKPFETIDNELLISLEPRFFTPTEIARLHSFPIDQGAFQFPPGITLKQQWKLLGNSLNVNVVQVLLKYLFSSTFCFWNNE
jgi:tRNA (cytosine38-C5)-methyltransferase